MQLLYTLWEPCFPTTEKEDFANNASMQSNHVVQLQLCCINVFPKSVLNWTPYQSKHTWILVLADVYLLIQRNIYDLLAVVTSTDWILKLVKDRFPVLQVYTRCKLYNLTQHWRCFYLHMTAFLTFVEDLFP